MIRYETRSFFIQGGDMEDLHQEGLIGLVMPSGVTGMIEYGL